MSEEMLEKKKLDEEITAKEQAQLEQDMELAKDDACPHCLQAVSTMPYINFHPILGWLECAACGVIFSPRSIRAVKLRKAKSSIIMPPDKILRPVAVKK